MQANLTPLQQQLKKQQEAADQAAQQSLRQHEARLSEAAEAALSTFKSDIKARHKWLLTYLVLWPTLYLLSAAGLATGGIWLYWKVQAPYETHTTDSGRKYQQLKGDWFRCNPKDENSDLCRWEP